MAKVARRPARVAQIRYHSGGSTISSILLIVCLLASLVGTHCLSLQRTCEQYYWDARSWIKIYSPPEYRNFTFKPGRLPEYIGDRVHAPSETSLLGKLDGWLFTHDEFKSQDYVRKRLQQDADLFTSNIEKAALCYPSCSFGHEPDMFNSPHRVLRQIVVFEVVKEYKAKFQDCEYIGWSVEPLNSKIYKSYSIDIPRHCLAVAPHVHSVYCPHALALPPWELALNRTVLLSYFGSHHGERNQTLTALNIAQKLQETFPDKFSTKSDKYIKLFETPDLNFYDINPDRIHKRDSHLYIKFWEMYATSIFSWQPPGDSVTRRAFYDSWVFGCIPVISRTSSFVYEQLFHGIPFQEHSLHEVIIVVDDEMFYDGFSLIAYLANISKRDIALRQARMRMIAPIMQWGWNSYGEALSMVFASILTSTKQSIALKKVIPEDNQVLDESLYKVDSKIKPHGQNGMTREEFEASLFENGKLIALSPPTMKPTRKPLSREEFEKSEIVHLDGDTVIIPPKKKEKSAQNDKAKKKVVLNDPENSVDFELEKALFAGASDSIKEEEKIKASTKTIVVKENDKDYFKESESSLTNIHSPITKKNPDGTTEIITTEADEINAVVQENEDLKKSLNSGDEASDAVLMDNEELKNKKGSLEDSTSEIVDTEESVKDVVQSNDDLKNLSMTSVSDNGELDYVVSEDSPDKTIKESENPSNMENDVNEDREKAKNLQEILVDEHADEDDDTGELKMDDVAKKEREEEEDKKELSNAEIAKLDEEAKLEREEARSFDAFLSPEAQEQS